MRQTNINYFAVLFATLVLLQDIYSHLAVNFDENAGKRSKTETEERDTVEIKTSKARQKS